jgi:hypothetical protein
MSPYRPSQPRRAAAGNFSTALIGLIVVAVIGGLGYLVWGYVGDRERRATDTETGCLTNAPTPQAVLFMVDATDRLSRENSLRIRSRIMDAVENLPRYSRVIILPFGGDTAAPLLPVFNKCLPGRAANARFDEGGQLLEEDYAAFSSALQSMTEGLQQLPDSRTSPIAGQIVRAASDPQLHWNGAERSLVLITDGLESSIYWTRHLRLEDPPERLLEGIRAEYFEIGNERGNRLQTREMRLEWKSWLERAGADVRVTAPGFSANPS